MTLTCSNQFANTGGAASRTSRAKAVMANQSQGPNDVIPADNLDGLLDPLLAMLLNGWNNAGNYVDVEREHIEVVCSRVANVFNNEPMVLDLQCPINVVGDVHGQFIDLLRIFHRIGFPPEKQYLCLGDYVDRGPQSVEVATLLFAYKLKYPHNIYLLRGNHESERMCRFNGFEREIIQRYNDRRVLNNFIDAFNYMPIAAIIEQSVFCTHGGISRDLMAFEVTDLRAEINRINRPVDVPTDGIMCELLWSDPIPETDPSPFGWKPSMRGSGFRFGYDVTHEFLDKYEMTDIIRAHQYMPTGFRVFHDRLMSIFSAPNYMNRRRNKGAIAIVTKRNEMCNIEGEIFEPLNIEYRIPFMV
ncbi:Serine/threonine-protein phosphatase PP1-2 [Taenia solium]|eukprot:TsM_000800200 transcript=TsM_000800200 gene=TsM_000800200